mgnify:CR=1 FL=1
MTASTSRRGQTILWRLEALAYEAADFLARLFPIDAVSDFGAWFFRTFGPLTSPHRVAETNLRIAFPSASDAEIARLLDEQWDHLGRWAAEFPILDRIVYNGERSDSSLDALKLGGESVATKQGAQLSLSVVDDALVRVNSIRADLGAMQNRLQSTINNLAISDENLSAANSRIRDVDVAEETSQLARNQVLAQAGTSMLAQANQLPQMAMQLLQG